MERLVTVKDVSERYGCSGKTARKYLRQMYHFENPLAAPLWAFNAWEESRGRMPEEGRTILHQKTTERVYVPRKRD